MQAGIASPTKDQDNEKRSQSNLRTEIRQGAAMSLRARQLISKNKAFARAYADMIKRGLRPVFEEHGVTILAVDLTKLISYRRTSTAGLQDITDGSHEMSFFPFDNGNAATWEGIVYVRGPNDEATYQVMLDTTHEDLSQTEVYYEIYYPPDGGPGECTDGPCPILASLSDSNYAVRQVSIVPGTPLSPWSPNRAVGLECGLGVVLLDALLGLYAAHFPAQDTLNAWEYIAAQV